MYLIALLKRMFRMPLIFEKISHIEIISSIQVPVEEEEKNEKHYDTNSREIS